MQLYEKFGRKETIRYLQAKKAPFFRWWIGLNPSYMWMKAKHITLPFNLHGWWLSPFTILGIG